MLEGELRDRAFKALLAVPSGDRKAYINAVEKAVTAVRHSIYSEIESQRIELCEEDRKFFDEIIDWMRQKLLSMDADYLRKKGMWLYSSEEKQRLLVFYRRYNRVIEQNWKCLV